MTGCNYPTTCHGYVVIPRNEYDELLAQIDQAYRSAHEAHSLSAAATLKAKQDLESTLDNLCIIETLCWAGSGKISVHFNDRALFDLAMRKLVKTFSEEELAQYKLKEPADFIIGDITLGNSKPEEHDGKVFGVHDAAPGNRSAAWPPKPDDADLAPGAETL